MKKLNILLIILIFIGCLLLSGCKNNENQETTQEATDSKCYDELGNERPSDGTYSECIIISDENYNSYKDKLIGNSGESGLLNRGLFNLNNNNLNSGDYYFIYFFYGNTIEKDLLGYSYTTKFKFNAFFRASMLNENELLFDNDALEFKDIICNNYEVSGKKWGKAKLNVSFDITNDINNRMEFEYNYDGKSYGYMFFTIVLPFEVKNNGLYDINFAINDKNSEYEIEKRLNFTVGINNDSNSLAKIDNFSVSYIPEYLCGDGNIDDSELTSEAVFSENISKLMVVDFDLKTIKDNNGDNKINLYLYFPKDYLLKTELEESNTSEIEEYVLDDNKIIKLQITVLSKKDGIKHCRTVLSLEPISNENKLMVDLFINGNCLSINNYKKDSILINVLSNDVLEFYEDWVAHSNDKTIKELYIPAVHDGYDILYINEGAFSSCEDLTYVKIEEGIKTIYSGAFKNCKNLKYINFPLSIEEVSCDSFDGCNDELFTIVDDCCYIGNTDNKYLVLLKTINKDVTSININPNTKVIADSAFLNCSELKKIDLMNVKYIGSGAFKGCSSLNEIIVRNELLNIGQQVFNGCTSLKEFKIPTSMKSIRSYAFSYSCLTSVTIPDSVTSIGKYAFSDCSSLTSIEIPNSVTSIGECAFSSCGKLTSITIPNSLTSIGESAFYNCSSLTSIEIPNSVTSIGEGAFNNCSSLTSIEIPNSVTSIGKYAFYKCSSLTSIEIPNSLTSIGNYAFSDCSNLTNIYYDGTIEDWCNITFGNEYSNPMCYESNFYLLDTNGTVEYNGNKYSLLTNELVIPNTITKINEYVFCGFSNLTNIIIPRSVEYIESDAFYYCNSLNSVYYEGTILEWQNIYVADNKIKNATIIYNYNFE